LHPKVAIVGPFYNSQSHVKDWVKLLSRQTYPNFVLYLVDDASQDKTASHLIDATDDFEVPSIVLPLGKNAGPSAVRNLAVQQAIQDGCHLILLLDSDCRVEADWIERHVDFHLKHPEVGILGGAIDGVAHTAIGIADGFCSWFTAVPHSSPRRISKMHLSTTNMSIKSQVFEAIGNFDETLSTGEDVAFCRKAQRAGVLLWFQSDIIIKHFDRNQFQEAKRHHFRWGLHSFTLSTQEQGGYYEVLKKFPHPWMVAALIPLIATLNTVLVIYQFAKKKPRVFLYLPQIFALKWWNALGVYRGFVNPSLCLRKSA
jgi:GT2 family glycosyltransferase